MNDTTKTINTFTVYKYEIIDELLHAMDIIINDGKTSANNFADMVTDKKQGFTPEDIIFEALADYKQKMSILMILKDELVNRNSDFNLNGDRMPDNKISPVSDEYYKMILK